MQETKFKYFKSYIEQIKTKTQENYQMTQDLCEKNREWEKPIKLHHQEIHFKRKSRRNI